MDWQGRWDDAWRDYLVSLSAIPNDDRPVPERWPGYSRAMDAPPSVEWLAEAQARLAAALAEFRTALDGLSVEDVEWVREYLLATIMQGRGVETQRSAQRLMDVVAATVARRQAETDALDRQVRVVESDPEVERWSGPTSLPSDLPDDPPGVDDAPWPDPDHDGPDPAA